MIYKDRKKVLLPPSLDLSNPKSKASIELKDVKTHYITNKIQEEYSFSAYSNDDVKEALLKLFNGKCAYCECSIGAGAKYDIEHFRPKGRVDVIMNSTKGSYSPGYYWLAMVWENLLLSCHDCNRRSGQVGYDKATGKGCYFPVEGYNNRYWLDNDYYPVEGYNNKYWFDDPKFKIEEQNRLFINPCEENPEQYLEFNVDFDNKDRLGIVSQKGSEQKGYTSIQAFGLNRGAIFGQNLLEERIALLMELEKDYTKRIRDLDRTNNDIDTEYYLTELSNFISELKNDIDQEKKKYIAFRRAFLSSKKEELNSKYGIEIDI